MTAQASKSNFASTIPSTRPPTAWLRRADRLDHSWYRKNELKASETGEYGKQLGRDLLGNDRVKAKLKTWVIGAQAAGGGASTDQRRALRFRLYIEPSALLEASLRWETLCDPETGDPLFNGERYYFSRFLTSAEWSIVRQRTRSDLHALVAVANPPDLKTRLGLAAIDFNGELARAKTNLYPIPVSAALTPESPRRPRHPRECLPATPQRTLRCPVSRLSRPVSR